MNHTTSGQRNHHLATLSLLLAGIWSALALDATSFGTRIDVPANSGQVSVAFGDIDGDGKPDAVAANYSSGNISIHRNISSAGAINTGSFAPRVSFVTGSTPVHVRLSDVDGDGRLDVLVINQGASSLSILRNTATPGVLDTNSLAPKSDITTAGDPRWVAVGDLNGDGKPDLAVASHSPGVISLFENSSVPGGLSFSLRTDLTASEPSVSIEAGDMDDDGRLDLVVGDLDSGTVSVWRNVHPGGALAAASFAPRVAFTAGGGPTVTLADLDGDGRTDILSPNQFADSLSVLRNTSTPGAISPASFAPKVDFPTGSYPYSAATADFDDDGRPDVFVANAGSHTVSVYRNLANAGAFTNASLATRLDFPTGTGPRVTALVDVDGDGLLDIATPNLSQSSFSVLRQIPTTPPTTNNPTGLVALWRGDGDSADSIGSNHGSLVGPVGFAQGVKGQAFQLTGTGYIRVAAGASLRFTNELTLELWFKRSADLPWGTSFTLIDRRDLTTCNYGAIMSQNYGLLAYYKGLDAANFASLASALPSADVWHHVACTYRQQGNGVELASYLDGAPVSRAVLPGTLSNAINTAPIAIGSARDGAADFFKGLIDEVALHDRALTASQVLSNFHSVTLPGITNSPPGLVNDFNAGRDFSGASNSSGVWSYGWKQTVPGAFSALTQPWTATADNGVLTRGWILPSHYQPAVYVNDSTNTAILGGGQGVVPPGTVWMHPGINGRPENFGAIRFTAPSNANYSVSAAADSLYSGNLSGDTDFHVAVGATEVFGQFLAARAGTSFSNIFALNTGDTIDFAIGRGADGNEYGAGLKLALVITPTTNSGVVITNSPPDTNTPPTGLVALWRGNGNAMDSVGGNHGSLVGAVGFAQGMKGQAFQLSGASFVRIPAGTALRFSNELTLELWFKRSADLPWGTSFTLIDRRDWTTCNYGAIMSQNYGLLSYYKDAGAANFQNLQSALPSADAWHHFACTYRQRGNGVEVISYLDGSPVATGILPGALAGAVNSAPIALGSARDGASDFFKGLIDEVALYDRAMTAGEVLLSWQSVPLPEPPTDFNLGRDFSAGSNPAGVWSCGWKQTMSGPFTTLNQPWTASTDNGVPIHGWVLPSYGQPAVYANDGATTGNSAGGQLHAPPGTVWMHPGINGRPENLGAVRFTAPSNGNYAVSAAADSLYTGALSGDTDFHIAVGSTEVFGEFLAARAGTSFSNTFALNTGDTIEFAIGRGADGNEYGAGLKLALVITPTTNAGVIITNTPPDTNAPPTGPVFVSQPASYQSVSVGATVSFTVNVSGTAPFAFQWLFNGGAVSGANAATFVLSNAQSANSGTYRVVVNNAGGSVTSDAAVLNVTNTGAGGTLTFANLSTNRIHDAVGTNFVPAGGSMVVGLFAGPSSDALAQVGGLASFIFPGRFAGGTRYVSTVSPGQTAFVQVKVWDSAFGSTYEQAVAAGSKLGASSVFQLVLGGGMMPPPSLAVMPGFALQLPALPPPQIIAQPVAQSVPLNASAALSVTASGGGLSYQWFQNGVPKPGATSATLNLAGAQHSDAGDYHVVASNSSGSTTSQVATLAVIVERTFAVVSQPDANGGTLVSVPVVLESGGDVAGMTFVLRYNADLLSAPEVVWDASVSNGIQAASVPMLGRVQGVFALPGVTIPAGTQILAVVHFRARIVVTNSLSDLLLEVPDVANASGDLIPFGTDIRNGAVTVLPGAGTLGDNNGNGVLDVGDATLLMRLLSQIDSTRPWDTSLNDLNQNARVDSGDAIRILLAAAVIDPDSSGGGAAAKDLVATSEAAVISPSIARGSNGIVTFQVRLQNIRGQISGAAFTLRYPPDALRLADAQVLGVGSLVPLGSAVVWNVSPTNNYGQQDGRVRFVASSGNAWPSGTGVLARVSFQVQPGATNQFAWPLAVENAEVSALGYNRPVAGGRASFAGRSARAALLTGLSRLTNGPCRFTLSGDAEATYTIESSSDLQNWSVLTNIVNTSGKVQFSDPDASVLPHRFYRTRPVQP